MDYSKVNNALSGWQGPSSRRDRSKAELGHAMELMQAQESMRANAEQKEDQMDEWMKNIHEKAGQIAIRNEDKEVVQAMYDQEKDTFLQALEKSGNDPVKFMNSGGRRVMKDFYNNIAFSDEAKRIGANTKQVQSFYEQLEGSGGANAHLISNQSRRGFDAFMNGHTDEFHNVTLQQWEEPGKDAKGDNLAQKYMNTKDNYLKFKGNYISEYDLDQGDFENITDQQLESYVAGYVGGGRENALQAIPQGEGVDPTNKSLGRRVTRQFNHINRKPISTSAIASGSQEYSYSLKDFDSGRFTEGVGPESTDIVGNRGFVGDELQMSQASLGKEKVIDLESFIPDVQALDSNWYDEDGGLVTPGDTMGDLRPGAIFLGYKLKQPDGSYKLVKQEDLEGSPKDAEHTLIQEYESDDALWFSSNYYNELDANQSKTMTTYSDLKGLDGALGRYTAKGEVPNEQEPSAVAYINPSSSVEDIKSQLPNHEASMGKSMKLLGLHSNRGTGGYITSKSILLSLSAIDGDIANGIGGLVDRFNAEQFPALNAALVEGNSKKFFDSYFEFLTTQGDVDPKQAIQYITSVDQLRDKIQKAQN